MAVLLRESLFLNRILWNTETWYNLTSKEIEELELIEFELLMKMWRFSHKNPKLIPIDDDENIDKDVGSNTKELGKRGFCKSVIFTVLNVLVFKVTNWCKL